ncbi:transcriptional regulator [Lacihabitans sp. CCS-44]|uniref:ArsR/SmtB family transcription factor n=1 Tax=Lacihabitans sp. CCS-44 TaxID=2487331 RepID=UPI0020CBF333|nr:helix-turn-helix transcriptional regulator [Lacihabitans sp. CCS-44]MCP9756857.1 transcriptional regulator [Lacihabitans sp. CCS-44]
MDIQKITAALANKTRYQILQWLLQPEEHFSPHVEVEGFGMGVCVGKIHDKTGLSQSTTSHYLSILQNVDLVIPTRIGKWTYYKSNTLLLKEYLETLKSQLADV